LHGREPCTDSYELDCGYISITPLTLDLTNFDILETVASVLLQHKAHWFGEQTKSLKVLGPNLCE